MARILTTEMPHLMAALRRGVVDEYQALLVVAETATLSREHRQTVDAELAGGFSVMTPARAQAEAARIGYRLDPAQAVKRLSKSHADRRVTLRPAPDTMSYLTVLLPATDGVAVLAALTRHAANAIAAGDTRGKGALMTGELITRLTQPAAATGVETSTPIDTTNHTTDVDPIEHLDEQFPAAPAGVNIEIQLIMTDRALLYGDNEPATLTGYGPIPAPLARRLARAAAPATRSAAPPGATPPSATPTTPTPTPPADPPESTTGRDSAPRATRSRNTPAGSLTPVPPAALSSSPRPGTSTSAGHRRLPVRSRGQPTPREARTT